MKEKLTRNIGMKILSIIIAILLWIVINGITDPVRVITVKNIPVKMINEAEMISAGKLIEITSGDTVDIKIRAKRSIAESLTVDDFEAIADVTNKNEFNAVPIIVNCKTHGDSEVEVISTSTEDGTTMMHMSLVDLSTQNFAVSIITDGEVADGRFIFSSTVSPNLITISGSEKQLSKVARVAVIVNVDGATNNISQSYRVAAYDKNGDLVSSDNLTFSESEVKVEMKLARTREIGLVVDVEGTPAYGYACSSVEYAPHYITVAADDYMLTALSTIHLTINVDKADKNVESTINLAAYLQEKYADAVKLVNESQNQWISCIAQIEPLQEKTLNIVASSIELRNCLDGYDYSIEQLTIPVTVRGLMDDIKPILSSQITAYIDCSSITEAGVYEAMKIVLGNIADIELFAEPVDLTVVQRDDEEAQNPKGIEEPET